MARLHPAIARLCGRAATSDYPRLLGPNTLDLETLPVRAGLRCALGSSAPDVLFVWAVPAQFQGADTAATFFFVRQSAVHAQPGDCATDDVAYQSWSFGLLAGRLLCVASPARARIDWIYGDEDLMATAERDDGDRAALYQWWLQEGRSLLH